MQSPRYEKNVGKADSFLCVKCHGKLGFRVFQLEDYISCICELYINYFMKISEIQLFLFQKL